MPEMPMPQMPSMPQQGPMGTAPAMPGPQGSGKPGAEVSADVIAGLGLELLRIAAPKYPRDSDKYITLAEIGAKLAKMFKKPPEDLGKSQLQFMQSQLYPGAPGGGEQGAAQPPAQIPQPGAMPMAA